VKVAIAGAHGKVGLRLARLLADEGNRVVGLIRNPDHAGDVAAAGASALVCDLEQANAQAIAAVIDGADAVVFAAGAGPGSGAARKLTVDRDGAIKLLEAACAAGVQRYLMIGAAGVESPPQGDGVFDTYMRAKAEADTAVEASDRDWTILRPGGLTDELGSGLVRIGTEPFSEPVPRDDVARVLARLLADPRSIRRIMYLSRGTRTVEQALDEVLGAPR
jgi:uncharacterized protein YbjT (DUF2867 family)